MGIMDLSLSLGPYWAQTGYRDGVLIREANDSKGERDIRLVWNTQNGSDWHKEWEVRISARGTEKGMPQGTGGWTEYSRVIPASECGEYRPYSGSRTWWNHKLDIGTLLSDFAGGRWLFSARRYDGIELRISCQSNFQPGKDYAGSNRSDLATLDCSVNYCPAYALTGASYTADDKLVITYAADWTRTDDRFYLEADPSITGGACTVDGEPLLNGSYTGTVSAAGRIEVPGERLTRHVVGRRIYINCAFNAQFRPVGLEFARMKGEARVSDARTCSTPRLRVVGEGESIEIEASDTGDADVAYEYCVIRMVGSQFATDSATAENGGTAIFRSAPFGTVEFEAVGYTSSGAVSGASARVSARSSGRGDAIVVSTDCDSIALDRFMSGSDRGISVSASPVVEVVKIAGRRRPTSFYGRGRSGKVSFEAVVKPGDIGRLLDMCEQGDMVARDPLGSRYRFVPSVDITTRTAELVVASISGEEVGG